MDIPIILPLLSAAILIAYFTLGVKNIRGIIIIAGIGFFILICYYIWDSSPAFHAQKSARQEEAELRDRITYLENAVKDEIDRCRYQNLNPDKLRNCIENVRIYFRPELISLKDKMTLVLEDKAKRKSRLRLFSNILSVAILIYVGILTYKAWKAKPVDKPSVFSNLSDDIDDVPYEKIE